MNAYIWTFSALLALNLILYIIGLVQRLNVMEKIARSFFIPFASGILLSTMTAYLPDSYHILLVFSIAAAFYTLSLLCTIGDKKAFFKHAEIFFFTAASVFWSSLLFSVYRIHKVHQLVFIVIGIVYLAGFITICIFIKKQKFTSYLSAILQYAINSFLSITTFISLIYEKRLFGLFIFIGSLCAMFYSVFQIFQKTRPFDLSYRKEKIILTMTTLATCLFMGTGALLMLYR